MPKAKSAAPVTASDELDLRVVLAALVQFRDGDFSARLPAHWDGIGGKIAEQTLDRCGITCNKNMIPYDERKPMDPSGIRLGTPAITTRGMGCDEMKRISQWILRALRSPDDAGVVESIRGEVADLAEQFPVPAARLQSGAEAAV